MIVTVAVHPSDNRRLTMPYSDLHDDRVNGVYFRSVANYTYDWESWHAPDGALVWVNESVQRLTGFSVAECLQMPDYPLAIVAVEDRQRMQQMLAEARDRQSRNDYQFQIITRDGQRRAMAVSWQPMYDTAGVYRGFRTSVRDVTERQALRDQLRLYTEHLERLVDQRTAEIAKLENHRRQMEKMAALGELAAGAAHEVNNPLAGIRNVFALLKGSLDPSHEHYDLLDLVDKEIQRISSIVHQMYQLYSRAPLTISELDVARTVQDVCCLLEPIAERYRVAIDLQLGEQSIGARLPESELKQILFNLIRNAIQASQPGQTVTLRASSDDAWLRLQIIDRGSGIASDILPHIFEPFYSTKNELKEGMGLGLSVSHNLVQLMGGTIDVKTEVGVGTTFSLALPRQSQVE